MEINETIETADLTEDFKTKFLSFALGCIEIANKHNHISIEDHNKSYPDKQLPITFHDKPYSISIGKRYIKLICDGSVRVFIDRENGDILKPASWSAPAKHARGNIFDADNGLKLMGPYGPAYLR